MAHGSRLPGSRLSSLTFSSMDGRTKTQPEFGSWSANHSLALLVWCMLGVVCPTTSMAVPMRRLFEPTDLELEQPGVMEVDMQYGPVRGQDGYRLSTPDFEIDLGLTNAIEL